MNNMFHSLLGSSNRTVYSAARLDAAYKAEREIKCTSILVNQTSMYDVGDNSENTSTKYQTYSALRLN